jgi:hypothetical protein
MDLVQFSISPEVRPDLKRKAEDQVIAKMARLPLGQKITLARRSPARIAGSLWRMASRWWSRPLFPIRI